MIKFPDDFTSKPHKVILGAKQWSFKKGNTTISVVGGGFGLKGDGVTTFEMWDLREDEVRGYLTAEEINEHLEKHPL